MTNWQRRVRMPNMAKKTQRPKLSDQVRQALADCGESRYAICKKTGLHNATLCRFMSGERGLTTTALDTLAEYLDLSIVTNAQRK